MEDYILYTGEIEGKYREVQIYPVASVPNKFVIHWDMFEVGSILKLEGQWHTNTPELQTVVKELGTFIDSKKSI